jgi:hypothetical protein
MFEGLDGTKSEGLYDLVLQAVGRSPNGKKIGADKAGVAVSDRGFIPVDVQMRTNVPHIFAIGDIVGQPMLAHKAVHEAHVAAEVAAGDTRRSLRRPRDPQRGLHRPRGGLGRPDRGRGQGQGHRGQEGPVPVDGVGPRHRQRPRRRLHQAAVRRRPDGHRILGGGIVGTHAGDMIGEVALAIEMGADAVDIGKTIHPHPTLGESIGMAAEVAHGSCTDLPPARPLPRSLALLQQQVDALEQGRFVIVEDPPLAAAVPLARSLNAAVRRMQSALDGSGPSLGAQALRRTARTDPYTGRCGTAVSHAADAWPSTWTRSVLPSCHRSEPELRRR